ncbi:hypothetical protein JCM39068_44230 [Desulfocastanea catecholica]
MCGCGRKLVVQKTRRKSVLSMNGPFIAHETVYECRICSRVFGSEELLRLAPSRCNVAYDILVFVGEALFRRHQTILEVRAGLIVRNVRLSNSEIAYLGRKFITFLAAGHHRATPGIHQAMKLSGGYVLHLDATHEGDAPALMTGVDSLSKIVLANVKLPSEHADHIVPFLRKLQADYGTPSACVHDMGTGIIKAVAEVFPNTRDLICHFHFLRDIGKDFLDPAYGELRKRLRSHAMTSRLRTLVRNMRGRICEYGEAAPLLMAEAIKNTTALEDTSRMPLATAYSLALWALQGKHCGDGYGFPFDRPLLVFAERLIELSTFLSDLIHLLPTSDRHNNQPLFKLARIASRARKDIGLRQAVEELRQRSQTFDLLRKAMRIALPGGGNGLNDDGTPEDMASIRQGVARFREELEKDPKFTADRLSQKMAEQIDKYGDKLFAEPIEVMTPQGKALIYPQRTNNILEQFFRGVRRGHRRKTGNNSMHRVLQTMLADTPLVKNLDNPAYMEILLDGKENLVELFAELGPSELTNAAAESHPETDRLLPGFRALINHPTLPKEVAQLFTRHLERSKSN